MKIYGIINNDNSLNKVTFSFYFGHSTHHQDLIENIYRTMEIVLLVDSNLHHIVIKHELKKNIIHYNA